MRNEKPVVAKNGVLKKKTVTRSVRASTDFFDMVDTVSIAQGITRNELIFKIVSEYCEDFLNGNARP